MPFCLCLCLSLLSSMDDVSTLFYVYTCIRIPVCLFARTSRDNYWSGGLSGELINKQGQESLVGYIPGTLWGLEYGNRVPNLIVLVILGQIAGFQEMMYPT